MPYRGGSIGFLARHLAYDNRGSSGGGRLLWWVSIIDNNWSYYFHSQYFYSRNSYMDCFNVLGVLWIIKGRYEKWQDFVANATKK